jgi:competence ComEA-like helix-hairpin-helix protein
MLFIEGARGRDTTVKRRAVLIGMWISGLCFWLLLAYRLNMASQPTEAAETLSPAVIDSGDTPADGGQGGAGEAGRSESIEAGGRKGGGAAPGNCVDVNSADSGGLVALSGIGPVLASRIVTYRKANGPFRKPEDLVGVKGIGPAKLEKIRGRICF